MTRDVSSEPDAELQELLGLDDAQFAAAKGVSSLELMLSEVVGRDAGCRLRAPEYFGMRSGDPVRIRVRELLNAPRSAGEQEVLTRLLRDGWSGTTDELLEAVESFS